jgi:hypothetical protein
MHGILKLRAMIQDDPTMGWRDRYNAHGTTEILADTPVDSPAVNVFPPGDTSGA